MEAAPSQEKILRPSSITEASALLVHILDSTPANPAENPEQVAAARQEIRRTLEVFPELIPLFAEHLFKALNERRIDVGPIDVYMVGGRVVGKTLSAESDIDLKFAFGKSLSFQNLSGMEGKEWTGLKKKLLHEDFARLCEERGIPNHNGYPGRFQILGWGNETPQEVETGVKDQEKAIHLYRLEGELARSN